MVLRGERDHVADGGLFIKILENSVIREGTEEPIFHGAVSDVLFLCALERVQEGFFLVGVFAEFIADIFFHFIVGHRLRSALLAGGDDVDLEFGTVVLGVQKFGVFGGSVDAGLLHESGGDVDGAVGEVDLARLRHNVYLSFLSLL